MAFDPSRPNPHDRLSWRDLADYLGWTHGTVQKLVATEAWRWNELPWPAFHKKGSTRTHWLFADVACWRATDDPERGR